MIRGHNLSAWKALLCLLFTLSLSFITVAQESKIKWDTIESPSLEGNLIGDPATRPFAVYLPPSYETSDKLYPVVYALHPYGADSGTSMISLCIPYNKSPMDSMIKNDQIGEMIIILVDGTNRFCGSWYRSSEVIGDYEGYITKDLIDYVDSNYRTIAHRRSRGITGHSMGGTGSMYLALKYPEVFSVVVASSGIYHHDSDFGKSYIKQAASSNPKDWGEFAPCPNAPGAFAYLAAVCPNPDKPPFFLDKPYEEIDGKIQEVPDVMERWISAGIVDSELEQYLKQPVRLDAIKFVHGRSDGYVPVAQARDLDQAMNDLGIDHVYVEHGGGHEPLPAEGLQFLSDYLSFELPATTTVEWQGKLSITWGKMKRACE
ncbi:hypothetical protein FJZ31_03915 [Candidatus Poribacteria bacterium]|nr:hypothetical protein [Candidatus Poribacteria bacterium]